MFPSLPTRWRPGPANSLSLCFGGNRPETKGRETQPARPCGVRTRRLPSGGSAGRSFLPVPSGRDVHSLWVRANENLENSQKPSAGLRSRDTVRGCGQGSYLEKGLRNDFQ